MKKPMKAFLLCGMLGCLCYGGEEWLMLYGISKDSGRVES